jgi:biopolymer transport protein ExbD
VHRGYTASKPEPEMKIGGAKKIHYDSGPNMTPLVDVVMVILIFLMLAGSLAGSTRFLMSKQGFHAKGNNNSTAKPDPNQPPDINIRVDIMNLNALKGDDNGFVASCASPVIKKTDDPEVLKNDLDAIREKMVAAGTPLDKLQIVLEPGRGVQYQNVLKVYQAALRAKFTKVAMATSH